MAKTRYRYRTAYSDDEWSDPRRLWRVMLVIRRRQAAQGPLFRWRRRGELWRPWWKNATDVRHRFRDRMRVGPLDVYQFQCGGDGGPITAVLKFHPTSKRLWIGERVISAAKSELGTVYRFGEANGPEDPGMDAFDCSGLTQWSWATVGVFLPHSSEAQRLSANVAKFSQESLCIPGDLVFFWFPNSRGITPGHASHVGMWFKPGFVLDTRSQSSPVAIREMETNSVISFGRPKGGQP